MAEGRGGGELMLLLAGKTRRAHRDWKSIIPLAASIVASYSVMVTLRQLHYRLVSAAAEFGYENTQSAYNVLSRYTVDLRRDGAFPPLLDVTRRIHRFASWTSPSAAISEAVDTYRRPRTEGQPVVPVLIAEKETLTELLSQWFTDPYDIPVVPLRGFQSEWLERQVADEFGDGRCRALYLGDFDSSGEDIERNAREQFGHVFSDWERVLLTPEIVARFDLPVAMGKATDSRSAGFLLRHGQLVQVEVEALDPNDMRGLIWNAISETWDDAAYEASMEREQEERDALEAFSDTWKDEA